MKDLANFGYELRSAWYYYECRPDHLGVYRFFSSHPHIKTNWLTPGRVPAGRRAILKTVRLKGLDRRNDETDQRNWLRLLVAHIEDPLKLPPWLLLDETEIGLPMPVLLNELVSFEFHISIEASHLSLEPEKRPIPPILTLFIGVEEGLRT